jgi:hypothetical protein
MTTTTDIRWFMTAKVAKILRNDDIAIVYDDASQQPYAADTRAYRKLYKAYAAAYATAVAAHAMGVRWPVADDRMGLHVQPDMLVAAATADVPFEWADTPMVRAAIEALADIDSRF